MSDGHSFSNISLAGRGGTNPGQLRVHSSGVIWKKLGGGKAVEVDKSDLLGLTWMKIPRSNQLGIRTKDGLYYKFTGFRDQDVASLTTFFQSNYGKTPEEKQLSVSGKNWGEVDLNGNMLTFLVDNKQAFEISLADVAQTQLQGKNDVMLEFHVDDTTGANEKDSLMEMTFHIPNSNTQFVGDESRSSAEVFRDKIISMADVGAGGEEAVATFDLIAILTPRGRYSVELHLSFLRLQGQANDFKIQYSSVMRVFWLPKSNQPHTFVVITLDPPIRKGQTLYPHIVIQFETETRNKTTLSMSEDLYNTKYKDKLKPEYEMASDHNEVVHLREAENSAETLHSYVCCQFILRNCDFIHNVFIAILRGLSGAKITKPGNFRSNLDGYAVKSSLKAEDGLLYPLEKSFFFLPKPPTLILHDDIDFVEFERHTAGGSNMHYFDFLIKLKTEQEHLFRNVQRNEYHNLFQFVKTKGLKIMNLGIGGVQNPEGVTSVLRDNIDDAFDPHLERIKNEAIGDESDDEDEDFVVEKDDGGSPTDDSGEGESDASGSGDEAPNKKKLKKEPSALKGSSNRQKSRDGDDSGKGESDASDSGEEAPNKRKHKKGPTAPKTSSSKKKSKDGDEDGPKKKKQKKKKDPNAPKRAISAFMFFSQTERENVKKDNPGIAFTEVGRVLGERWNKMTVEEKVPYEAKARADKRRYTDEISGYKNTQAAHVDLVGGEYDSA